MQSVSLAAMRTKFESNSREVLVAGPERPAPERVLKVGSNHGYAPGNGRLLCWRRIDEPRGHMTICVESPSPRKAGASGTHEFESEGLHPEHTSEQWGSDL